LASVGHGFPEKDRASMSVRGLPNSGNGYIDFSALSRIAEPGGTITLDGQDETIVCRPRQHWRGGVLAFDRAVSRCGLVKFIRPAAGEWPDASWTLVSRLAEGIRVRQPVQLFLKPGSKAATWLSGPNMN
jgi:hypothetical protein